MTTENRQVRRGGGRRSVAVQARTGPSAKALRKRAKLERRAAQARQASTPPVEARHPSTFADGRLRVGGRSRRQRGEVKRALGGVSRVARRFARHLAQARGR